MIWLPTTEQVIRTHTRLIEKTGGTGGIRDIGLIESAVMRASAGFGGQEVYSTIIEKSAAVCAGLIGNHGFVDGNKRIGVVALLMILERNGIIISFSQQALIDLGLSVARGDYSVESIVNWITDHLT